MPLRRPANKSTAENENYRLAGNAYLICHRSRPTDGKWRTQMKALILAAFASLTLVIGINSGFAESYHTPANNYYQNNWMNN
jgi:hypothetical protein